MINSEHLYALSIETTGLKNPVMVKADIAQIKDDVIRRTGEILINGTHPVEEDAKEIHKRAGITPELMEQSGQSLFDGLEQLITLLYPKDDDMLIITSNASYVKKVLDNSAQESGYGPYPALPLVDLVGFDRVIDQYRPGKRTMPFLCDHYHIPWDETDKASSLLAVFMVQLSGIRMNDYDAHWILEKTNKSVRETNDYLKRIKKL
jgi:DNA polymerase-3 subunit epsilon